MVTDHDRSRDDLLAEISRLRLEVTEARRQPQQQQRAEQRLRDAVWAMRSSDDLEGVLEALRGSLRDLGIDFEHCGVNLVGLDTPIRLIGRRLDPRIAVSVLAPDSPEATTIRGFVAGGEPVYRRDLEQSNPYQEQGRMARLYGAAVRSVVDAPFSHGTLAVNSLRPDAFSDAQVAALQRLAVVLGEAFLRRGDFARLERRTAGLQAETAERRLAETALRQALQRERALNRIRDRILCLDSLGDLCVAVQREWVGELRSLGIPVQRLSLYWRPDHRPAATQTPHPFPSPPALPWPLEGQETGQASVVTAAQLTARACWDKEAQSVAQVPVAGIGWLEAVSVSPSAFDAAAVAALQSLASLLNTALGRINALVALRESEQRLRLHAELSPLGVITWDADFSIAAWTGAAERIFGWSAHEVVGRAIMDLGLIYDADLPQVRRVVQRLMSGTEPQIIAENRNNTKDGRIVWCEWYNTAVTDASGRMVSVNSLVVDVTARVAAEAQRRDSEGRRQAMLAALPDMILQLARDGTVLDYKPAFDGALPPATTDVIGRRHRDLLPPDVSNLFARGIAQALESGSPQTFGCHLGVPERGIRAYEVRMARSGADEVTAVVRDVTEVEDQEFHVRVDRALQRLRAEIHTMAGVDDWVQVIKAVDEQLRTVLACHQCSVALIDLVADRTHLFWVPPDGAPEAREIRGVRPSLRDALVDGQPAIRRRSTDPDFETALGPEVQMVVDAPFPGGTLAINRAAEGDVSAREMDALRLFAGVVGEAAQRFADLRAQQQIGAALAESEQLHRSLVEVSPAAIFIHSDGCFVFANPAGARLLGAPTPVDVLGRRVADFVHPEHLPQVRERVSQALRSGDAIPLAVERLLRLDGVVIDAEIAGTPLVYHGKPAIQVIAYDVTERRRAEESLAAIDRRYRLLFERSYDAVFMFRTSDGRYLDANAAAVELVGRPLSEITQLTTLDLAPVGAQERLEALAQSEAAIDMAEVEYLRPDGGRRVTLLTAVPVDESISFGLAHDITERKEAENAMRVSLALERVRTAVLQMEAEEDWISIVRCVKTELRPLVRVSGVSICLVDAESRTATTYLPESAPHLERRTADFVYPALQQAIDTGRPVVRSTTDDFLRFGDPFGAGTVGAVVDVPFLAGTLGASVLPGQSISEGDIRILSQFAQVLSQAHRRLEGIRWRSQAEAELTQKRLLAVRADRLRALGEMASGVAHELNQPLNGIRTFAEGAAIAIDRGWDMTPGETLQTFRDIVEQVDRATAIIDHMRDFARKPGQKRSVEFDINGPVSGALKLLGTQLRVHGIAVDQHLSTDMPKCTGSDNEIEQVVLNLLSNARDAIDDRADREKAANTWKGSGWLPQITIRTWADADAIALSIADTGGGVPGDVLTQIFDPFFTTKPVGKGTGIGLSIARGIVDAHGGTIEVDNRPGDGVAFTVKLPVRPRE